MLLVHDTPVVAMVVALILLASPRASVGLAGLVPVV